MNLHFPLIIVEIPNFRGRKKKHPKTVISAALATKSSPSFSYAEKCLVSGDCSNGASGRNWKKSNPTSRWTTSIEKPCSSHGIAPGVGEPKMAAHHRVLRSAMWDLGLVELVICASQTLSSYTMVPLWLWQLCMLLTWNSRLESLLTTVER